MSHIDHIFEKASDAQTRRRVQDQRCNPLPLLGRALLPAGMIDVQLGRNKPELALYSAAHGAGGNARAEHVGVFILNSLFGLPDWHPKGKQDEAGTKKIARIKKSLPVYQEELRERGCASVCLLENYFAQDAEREILQYGLYVPNSRYYRTENGGFWFEPNIPDQVVFLKFLIEKGHIDPEQHREMIIDAFNARVLYLAQTDFPQRQQLSYPK